VKSKLPWLGVQRMLLHLTDDKIESYTVKGLKDAS
jgi:hypothetical protein